MKKNIFLLIVFVGLFFACNTKNSEQQIASDANTYDSIPVESSENEYSTTDSITNQLSKEASDLKEESNKILEELNN
ncbi:hypothetical protein [Marinigracilibium pacificum]|uniref:Lipoprotein n=1 Tax=Marinigracilibium pacificum TaxID=2729599 RepID=A0A848J6Y2_9BACT|nr:hypothetical protein [Marinigracilibium pacificum]NMM50270.1 hypothetical protein [Marinigracilibium pacificum]